VPFFVFVSVVSIMRNRGRKSWRHLKNWTIAVKCNWGDNQTRFVNRFLIFNFSCLTDQEMLVNLDTIFFTLQLLYLMFCWKIIRGANIRGFLLLHVKCLCTRTKIHSTPCICGHHMWRLRVALLRSIILTATRIPQVCFFFGVIILVTTSNVGSFMILEKTGKLGLLR
jgi:hypothetical protein